MKYYRPDHGETREQARTIEGCYFLAEAARMIAETVHYSDPFAEFPIFLVIIDNWDTEWDVTVERECVPHFTSTITIRP